jgi:hypothetical protein
MMAKRYVNATVWEERDAALSEALEALAAWEVVDTAYPSVEWTKNSEAELTAVLNTACDSVLAAAEAIKLARKVTTGRIRHPKKKTKAAKAGGR